MTRTPRQAWIATKLWFAFDGGQRAVRITVKDWDCYHGYDSGVDLYGYRRHWHAA